MDIDRAAYRRDGYLVLRGFVGAAVAADVVNGLSRILGHQLVSVGWGVAINGGTDELTRRLIGLFRADRERYFDALRLAQHLPQLQVLGGGPGLCDLGRALGISFPVVSTRQTLHIMSSGIKVQDGYDRTPAHQDWRSNQGSLDSLTVWAAMRDIGPRDFPLEIIPGSHLSGCLPDAPHRFGHQVDPAKVESSRFVPIPLAAGDAIAFSAFLVHRTSPAGGKDARVAASFRLNNADDPSYIARGYRNPYSYKLDLNLRDAPSAEEVRAVFARRES